MYVFLSAFPSHGTDLVTRRHRDPHKQRRKDLENSFRIPNRSCWSNGPRSSNSKGTYLPALQLFNGLATYQESPRYLASKNQHTQALNNLAYLRRSPPTSEAVLHEMAEINAAINEEQETRRGLGWKEAFLGKGNWPRFGIAFVIFLLQQWSGQNSVK